MSVESSVFSLLSVPDCSGSDATGVSSSLAADVVFSASPSAVPSLDCGLFSPPPPLLLLSDCRLRVDLVSVLSTGAASAEPAAVLPVVSAVSGAITSSKTENAFTCIVNTLKCTCVPLSLQ